MIDLLIPETQQNGLHYENIWYPISCFFYSMAGFIRIHQGYNIDGLNLIVQSFLSFISDVITLSEDSIWHPIDRYFAFYTCIYHFYTLISYPISFILNLIVLLIGYEWLTYSQDHYKNDDR